MSAAGVMRKWKIRILRLAVILRRYRGIIAVFAFLSGVASFVLVDRQEGFARVIALVMLVSWLWLVLENVLRHWLDVRFRFRLPEPVLRYATQLIHQESLFFVLPFLVFATVWNSAQALFTSALICAALISVIDPVYYKWLAPRRWLYLGYHTLALFVVLLTVFPIILHIPTPQSYMYALLAAVVLSFPSLAVVVKAPSYWRGALLLLLVATLGGVGWLGRFWVPPSTLRLADMAVSLQVDRENRAPESRIRQVSTADLREIGLYAYTAIHAPLGLEERIFHVWLLDGEEVDRIPIEIQGGREKGYRAWSHKLNFPEQSAGDWRIDVLTEAGQMIGRLRFEVLDGAAAPRPEAPPETPPDVTPEVTPEAVPQAPAEATPQLPLPAVLPVPGPSEPAVPAADSAPARE